MWDVVKADLRAAWTVAQSVAQLVGATVVKWAEKKDAVTAERWAAKKVVCSAAHSADCLVERMAAHSAGSMAVLRADMKVGK